MRKKKRRKKKSSHHIFFFSSSPLVSVLLVLYFSDHYCCSVFDQDSYRSSMKKKKKTYTHTICMTQRHSAIMSQRDSWTIYIFSPHHYLWLNLMIQMDLIWGTWTAESKKKKKTTKRKNECEFTHTLHTYARTYNIITIMKNNYCRKSFVYLSTSVFSLLSASNQIPNCTWSTTQ